MGKKTPSPSSESVATMSSTPPDESLDQSIVSEGGSTATQENTDGEKTPKKEKMGLMKRMSLRRSEKKKDKEKEKEKAKEEKEKAKEEKEKAKEDKEKAKEDKEKSKDDKSKNGKDKAKDGKDKAKEDKSKDKNKDKDKGKDKDKDKRKEDGQRNITDKTYTKISMDDFEAKQTEFKLWMLEQQNGSIDTMKSSKVKSFFKKFVKEWNKKRLPHRYYWSSDETPPPSRAGSRFSFAEDVQTPDFLNFPAAPVDLSNDDLDSEESMERSGSFSTFGKMQKPEGLNDEVTPTMPKRPLLSNVFPVVNNSHETSAKVSPTVSKMMAFPVVICEDGSSSDPPTPTPETSPLGPMIQATSPVLLNYEHSPGMVNGALKERYAITPDNNNTRKSVESNGIITTTVTYDVETSNYTCMENNNILPGEELRVTEMLDRALQGEGLQPSGELTPIAEEDALNAEARHTVSGQTVVAALQPVVAQQQARIPVNATEAALAEEGETSWEVVNPEAESGQVTFRGLPPPPKQWKRDNMEMTQSVLPQPRPLSQEKAVTTSTEVTTVPVEVYGQEQKVEKIVTTTTVTTVEEVVVNDKSAVQSDSSEELRSPTVKSPAIAVLDSAIVQSPTSKEATSRTWTSYKATSPTVKSPDSMVIHRQQARTATVMHVPAPPEEQKVSSSSETYVLRSPDASFVTHKTVSQEKPRSPKYVPAPVVKMEEFETSRSEERHVLTSPGTSSVTFNLVSEEVKSPVMKEQPPVSMVRSPETTVVSSPPPVCITTPPVPTVVTSVSPQPPVSIVRSSEATVVTTVSPQPPVSIVRSSETTVITSVSPPASVGIRAPYESTAPETPSTLTIHQKSVSIPATSHVTLAQPQLQSPVKQQPVMIHQVAGTTSIQKEPERTVFVYGTENLSTSTRSYETHNTSPRQSTISAEVSPTPAAVPVQHSIITRSTPVVLQTEETTTYQSAQFAQTRQNTSFKQKEEVKVVSSPVSPTIITTPPKPKSPRNSAELKHDAEPQRRGPHLSPIIVNASTIPMLFQEAMKPVEVGSPPPVSPGSAPLRSPRSPDKPKPAPRPKSLRSPTSPGSRIPVAVKEESAAVVVRTKGKAPDPPERASRPESFKSSHTLVMATSPPPTQTSPRQVTVSPTTPSGSKIPPPKAPRPARSPVSPPATSILSLSTKYSSPPQPAQTAPKPAPSTKYPAPPPPVQSQPKPAPQPSPVEPSPVQPTHVVVTRDTHTRTLKPTSSVFAPEVQSSDAVSQPAPKTAPKPNVSRFMYEQPSFLTGRTDQSRRSMSRINFTPPKPAPKTRVAVSYIEPSNDNRYSNDVSYSNSVHNRSEPGRMSHSYSDYSVQKAEERKMTNSYSEPSPAWREDSTTAESGEDSLVRPEQTRATFGPTFMRLSGERRSFGGMPKSQYKQMHNIQDRGEQKPYRRDVVFSEDGQANPFRQPSTSSTRSVSASSETNLDPEASNLVHRYLTEIKESSEQIPGVEVTLSKSSENVFTAPGKENEEAPMRRAVSNTDHHTIGQTTHHTTQYTTHHTTHSRLPIYGTSAYRDSENQTGPQQGFGGRQYSTLPRNYNYKGVSMGAMVVEMGAGQPAKSQPDVTRTYTVVHSLQQPGDRRSYAGTAGEEAENLHTPGSRRSYAGHSPGHIPGYPSARQYSPGYHHHPNPLLTSPRDRNSFAGASTGTSTLSPEEMARLKEVLKR